MNDVVEKKNANFKKASCVTDENNLAVKFYSLLIYHRHYRRHL